MFKTVQDGRNKKIQGDLDKFLKIGLNKMQILFHFGKCKYLHKEHENINWRMVLTLTLKSNVG